MKSWNDYLDIGKTIADLTKEERENLEKNDLDFQKLLVKELSKEDIDKLKIDLGEIYEEIIKILKKFCDLKDHYYPLVALWIIGTYIHDEFETYPYLFFNAMRGSGKTRILRLIAELSCNGELLGSMSESVMFRTAKGSTMCIDEFENVSADNKQALRELLNSAYKKGQKIKRMKKVKEGYVVEEFEVYTSVCLANIWGMEEVLGDRCITIILEKSSKPFITKLIENYTKDEQIQKVKSQLSKLRCSLCNVVMSQEMEKGWNNYILDKYAKEITTLYTSYTYNTHNTLDTLNSPEFYNKLDEAGVEGRHFELTFPILMVSQFLNKFDEVLEIIKGLISEKKAEDITESRDIQVFDFVSEQDSTNMITMTRLTNDFRDFIGAEPKEHDWLNSRWMGRALKRLVLTTHKVRRSGGIHVLLNTKKAQEKMRMFK